MISPVSFSCTVDADSRVATVTLNRPERLNALTFDVYAELRDLFLQAGSDTDVRAIVITGAGRSFCSGGDIEEIVGPLLALDHAGRLDFTRLTCDLVRAIRACPRPVVAAVNGAAAGAGAVIAAACDLRVASASSRIAFLFMRIGLSGADMGAAWLLPRLVGFGRASELLLTGAFVDAAEALRIGLVNRVLPDDDMLGAAKTLAAELAQRPVRAIEKTKAALEQEAAMAFGAALDAEAKVQATLMGTPDFREAYEAFVARRPPRFA